MNPKSLTTQEVARLCRVSDATVKRWEDAGIIKSERTTGGHRRFQAEEIARFQRENQLGVKTSLADESALTTSARRRIGKQLSDCDFFQSLLAGCESEAANILINLSLKGKHVTKIFDEIVCRTFYKIGEFWAQGKLTVAQEHLATRTGFHAISKLRATLPPTENNGKIAMCCALEGDLHELPTFMVQVTLENLGYEVTNFGANTPLFCFSDEVLAAMPSLVCISGTIMENPERILREYAAFREKAVKNSISVVLGGRIFRGKTLAQRFEAEATPENFSQLHSFAARLLKN